MQKGLGCARFAVAALLAAAALAPTAQARAESAAQGEARAFCPARPGKVSPTCTIEPGRWQLEIDAVDGTWDRAAGVSTSVLAFAAPQLRIGLTGDTELQLGWTPYQRAAVHGSGADQAISGVGDTVAGAKLNLTGNTDGFGLALQPFVKIPTAPRDLGDGRVEGGIGLPVSAPLAGGWAFGATPEVDVRANDVGAGYHAAVSLGAGLDHALSSTLGFGVELWAGQDLVARAPLQATGDVLLTWTPPGARDLQLDAGVNLGLTAAAPDVQAYVGIAKRF